MPRELYRADLSNVLYEARGSGKKRDAGLHQILSQEEIIDITVGYYTMRLQVFCKSFSDFSRIINALSANELSKGKFDIEPTTLICFLYGKLPGVKRKNKVRCMPLLQLNKGGVQPFSPTSSEPNVIL